MTTTDTGPQTARPRPQKACDRCTQGVHGCRQRPPVGTLPMHLPRESEAMTGQAEAQRLTVERLAWAYHQTRLRYPGGSLFCGDEHGNPYDLDDATCSCRLDMMDVAEAYVRGPALAHPEEEQRP